MKGDSVQYLVRAFLFSDILPHGLDSLPVGEAMLNERKQDEHAGERASELQQLEQLEPENPDCRSAM